MLEDGTIDQADLQRMLGMLETKETNPVIDRSITADDLIDIADSDKSNLKQTRIVVNTDDGRPLWFERGNYEIGSGENHGWVYLKGRHIDANQFDEKPTTTLWPNGQDLLDRMERKLPEEPDGSIPRTVSEGEIERLVYDALDESDDINPDKGDNVYYDLPESKADDTGIETIRVRIEDGGRITTAHPEDGSDVYKWIDALDDWERNYENN